MHVLQRGQLYLILQLALFAILVLESQGFIDTFSFLLVSNELLDLEGCQNDEVAEVG